MSDEDPDFYPNPTIVPPTADHKLTIIFLHGRGSTGQGFRRDFSWSTTSGDQNYEGSLPGAKWIFPSSPTRLSSVFHIYLREWFDVASLTNPEKDNHTQYHGIGSALQYIHDMIEKEHQDSGLAYDKIFIAGISQGCATGMHSFLTFPHQLGGFIGMCGWLPFLGELNRIGDNREELATFYSETLKVPCGPEDILVSRTSPCLLLHSANDHLINVQLGRSMRDTLQKMGLAVQWIEWPDGGHWIKQPEGMDCMVQMLKAAITDEK